jgi:16S rRNA (cytidine1402-2'-O)-methyltransferase
MKTVGKLFVVATPIGNLNDISPRAIETLKNTDFVAAEDTRNFAKLAAKLEIETKKISFHQNSDPEKIGKILRAGNSVALVSDAGTPAISDPGGKLVQFCAENNFPVAPIPGVSAVSAALSVAGFPADRFEFLGFLPAKKGREKTFREIAEKKITVVFFESPRRILKFLNSAIEFFPERKIFVAREMTKIFEQFYRGTGAEILQILTENPDQIRGEFCVVIAPEKFGKSNAVPQILRRQKSLVNRRGKISRR